VSKEVKCKDSKVRVTKQSILKIFGWKHVECREIVVNDNRVSMTIEDTRHSARCPCCGRRSTSVHSHYFRQIKDLPLHGKACEITVYTHRYRCNNPNCPKETFAGQIEGITERYSRKSIETRRHMEDFLVHVPSTTGALQLSMSGLPVSPSTALRIVSGIKTEIDFSSVKRICIDDFASRKGREYRTLIADADTGLPLEIVKSRDESDVTKALSKYKKVKAVSRDRAGVYSKAVRKALPRAKQVADRFHLVMNCSTHIEDAIRHNSNTIRAEVESYLGQSATTPTMQMYHPPSDEDILMFNKVKELRKRGLSLAEIARELGSTIDRIKSISHSEAPHGRKITTPKLLLPYLEIIDQGVNNGESYKEIRKSILDSGGHISYDAILCGMKKLYPLYKPKQCVYKDRNAVVAAAEKSFHKMTRLISSGKIHLYVANPDFGVDKQTGECSEEHIMAEQIIERSQTLRLLRGIHVSFRDILKGKDPERLDEWISKYQNVKIPDAQTFVRSVAKDIKPIKNAICFDISNGLIEGLNNKVKAVKRSMYGRAGDRLLWIKMYQTCLSS